MSNSALLGSLGAYEGAFASPPVSQNLEPRGPFASVLAGAGAPVSNDPGTIQGRFGWLTPSGIVNNTRISLEDTLGIVIPFRSMNGVNGGVVGGPRGLAGSQAAWTWEFWDPTIAPAGGLRIRPGLVVGLHNAGNFWLRFAAGALYGDRVYASLVDGQAISGPADNSEITPFLVCSTSPPGALGVVSSTAKFSP